MWLSKEEGGVVTCFILLNVKLWDKFYYKLSTLKCDNNFSYPSTFYDTELNIVELWIITLEQCTSFSHTNTFLWKII